jgi:nitrilase
VLTGQAHWKTLLRARAVENLCYVVAAGQTGRHPGGHETYGHSMIIGPWGEVLNDAGSSDGVITADFDRAGLDELRHRFPALAHRHDFER